MNTEDNKRMIFFGKEASDAKRKAVALVGDIVSSTLGPAGRNALLDRARRDRPPLATNDGKSIAGEIRMENECEDLVVQSFVETTLRASDGAGDGTTTAITIGRKLIEDAMDEIGDSELGTLSGNKSVMEVSRQIEAEKEIVLKELKEIAEPVDTLEKLKDVAFSSVENKEIGDIVAEAVWEVGKDGFATQEIGYDGIIKRDTVQGMKVYAKYAAPFMSTNHKKQAVYNDAPILVSNLTFQNITILLGLFNDMTKEAPGKHNAMVVIGTKFESEAIRQAYELIARAEAQGKPPFRILMVKAPSLTDDELEDVASYVDARFINSDSKIGMKSQDVKYKDLGFAKKIIVGEDETIITGGRGLETKTITEDGEERLVSRVESRIEEIKGALETETEDIFKKKAERRLGIISGGISVVTVGAKSDTERSYLMLKVENAINSSKLALQEGVVKGGGLALKSIADKYPDMLISGALRAPNERILQNAGGTLEIGDNIIDPVKVTRTALESAVSVAKIIITTDTIIAEKQGSIVDELKNLIG